MFLCYLKSYNNIIVGYKWVTNGTKCNLFDEDRNSIKEDAVI